MYTFLVPSEQNYTDSVRPYRNYRACQIYKVSFPLHQQLFPALLIIRKSLPDCELDLFTGYIRKLKGRFLQSSYVS